MSWPLVKYVLMGAVRDKLMIALLVLLAVGSSIAIFCGSAAVIEKNQFALVFGAGGLRMAGVMGLILFVVFFVRRSFEAKDIEFLLSRPVSRLQLLLSYALAFSILALVMSIAIGICLYTLGPDLFGQGHALWVLSIAAETIIMVNVALFFAMYLSSAANAAMASLGFYVLARMIGQMSFIINHKLAIDSNGIVAMLVKLISLVTPRLDLMGQTTWLVYGVQSELWVGFVALQGLFFCALILLAALFDFVRRQF